MVNDLKLKGNELLVYAIIYGFSQDGISSYTGSLQYLADWTNSTKRGMIKVLQSLVEKNLIVKKEIFKNGQKYCEYKARGGEQSSLGGEHSSLGYGTKFTRGGEKSSPNTIINTINKTIDIHSCADAQVCASSSKKEDYTSEFSRYLEVMG